MRMNSLCRAAVVALVLMLPPAIQAHHGWSWTTGGNIQVTGVIVEARLGNPHGELVIDADGQRWTVEVGQPWRNQRAGLKDGDLSPGTELKVEGEPSARPEDRLLKVERLWIGGNRYELYPERS